MLRKRAWTAGNWSSPRSGRTRVLVESSDAVEQWALETALGDAGYDVAVCDGPSYHGAPCPLIRTGDCPVAAGADVIVNRFRLCEPANQDVLRAVRSHWPATPVIIEATPQEREHHAELLAGCDVMAGPQSTAGLLAAIRSSTGAAP